MSIKLTSATRLAEFTRVAQILTSHLKELGYKHSYLGWFSLALLGCGGTKQISSTSLLSLPVLTIALLHDIEVLVENPNGEDVRDLIIGRDTRFAKDETKLKFSEEGKDGSIRIKLIPPGANGLPTGAEPFYTVNDGDIALNILQPSVLILTRIQRWATMSQTPWRETVTKIETDKRDIDFLIHWLDMHELVIAFDLYQGRKKSDLLLAARYYYDEHIDEDDHAVDIDLILTLKRVLKPEDLDAMRAIQLETEAATQTDSQNPPTDKESPKVEKPESGAMAASEVTSAKEKVNDVATETSTETTTETTVETATETATQTEQ